MDPKAEIAPEEALAITPLESASASLVFSESDVSLRQPYNNVNFHVLTSRLQYYYGNI